MKRRAAFTLIELLVVVAIISLLITMLVPSLQAAKDLANASVCDSNLRQFHLALTLYAHDSADWFPVEPTEHNPHRGLLDALGAE